MAQPLDGQLVVRRGASISLESKANGNPSPTVSWVKLGGGGGGGGGGRGGGDAGWYNSR